MKQHYLFKLTLIIFFFPSLLNAYTNEQVAEWVQRTLMNSLTANYLNQTQGIASVRKNYKHSAWINMDHFLTDDVAYLHDQKLTLHPRPIIPTVVEIGHCPSQRCWLATQGFIIPEINKEVHFLLKITTTDPAYHSPFIIEELSVSVRE